MKGRQLIVNLVLVVLLVALGVFCYYQGKAYDVLMSNVAATDEQGVEHEALEAVQVRILPKGKAIRLYMDESLIYEGQIVGPKAHQLEIIPLDLEDKPIMEQRKVVDIYAREVPLVTKRGLTNRVVYVPLVYETGSVKIEQKED